MSSGNLVGNVAYPAKGKTSFNPGYVKRPNKKQFTFIFLTNFAGEMADPDVYNYAYFYNASLDVIPWSYLTLIYITVGVILVVFQLFPPLKNKFSFCG